MTTMTAYNTTIGSADPIWCSRHYEPTGREAFHQHNFERTWGLHDERIRLGLTRFDSDGRAGETRIEIQYLAEVTDVQGSASLRDSEVNDFVGATLSVLAMKKSAGRSGPALFFRCFYEAAKAFTAAVRYSRTCSPRTASSHSRSMSCM